MSTSAITHTVTTKSLASAVWSTGGTIPTATQSAVAAAFTASIATDNIHSGTGTPADTSTGTVAWQFSLPDHFADFLALGETLTLTYNVAITDDFPGDPLTSNTQTVMVVITGTNDTPVITSSAQAATITEDKGVQGSGGETGPEGASGTITFTDVDLSDVETSSITKTTVSATLANGYTLTTAERDALVNAFTIDAATHSSVDGSGTVGWHYNIDDSALDFLGAKDVVTLTYTVQVNDDNGGTTTQNVVITITGTNDAPVITSATSNAFSELPGTNNATTDTVSGTISFTDVDLTDRPTVTAPFASYSYTAADGHTALTLTAAQQSALETALAIVPACRQHQQRLGELDLQRCRRCDSTSWPRTRR